MRDTLEDIITEIGDTLLNTNTGNSAKSVVGAYAICQSKLPKRDMVLLLSKYFSITTEQATKEIDECLEYSKLTKK